MGSDRRETEGDGQVSKPDLPLLKRSVSTCRGCWPPAGKVPSVREERGAAASSLPVVRQGSAGQPRRLG